MSYKTEIQSMLTERFKAVSKDGHEIVDNDEVKLSTGELAVVLKQVGKRLDLAIMTNNGAGSRSGSVMADTVTLYKKK